MIHGTNITGKTALVTGGSRGIGRAIARRLASAGATVVVSGRSLDVPAGNLRYGSTQVPAGTLLETVALIHEAGGRGFAVAADLERDDEARGLPDKAAKVAGANIDILVNNAGYADFSSIADMSLDTFDRTISHFLRAPFIISQAAIQQMRKSGGGWIVNIGSQDLMPPRRPYPDHEKQRGYHVYAAAKAALGRLTQGMAAELVDDNIAVNMVGPSTAIRSPGADMLIPSDFPTEDPAYLAETVLAMTHLPAAERTGLIAYSLHYPWHNNMEVRSLDALKSLPPCPPPPWANPDIRSSGI